LSEPVPMTPGALAALRSRLLSIYSAVAGLSIFTILLLAAYVVHLGPLVGPGVESSFGLAAGLMFLEGALLVHIADRVYREWPLGRRVSAEWAGPVTDRDLARFLMVVTFAAALGAVAYIFWGILTT
jgi:hypothetical protein